MFLKSIVTAKESIAPYGVAASGNPLIRYGTNAAKVKLTFALEEEEVAFAGVRSARQSAEVSFHYGALPETSADTGLIAVLERYHHKREIGKLDYFPIGRRFELDSIFGTGDLVTEQKFLRLAEDPRKYRGIIRYLREVVLGARHDKLAEFKKLFTELAGGVTFAGLSNLGNPEFQVRSGETISAEALSSSAHQAFLFAATTTMIEAHQSVVLIDTPELHLPGGEAARRLQALSEHFPTTQWIVASNDPAVLELAPREARIVLGVDKEST